MCFVCMSCAWCAGGDTEEEQIEWYRGFELIWSIDPGVKSMITAVNQYDEELTITTGHYKHRAGMRE